MKKEYSRAAQMIRESGGLLAPALGSHQRLVFCKFSLSVHSIFSSGE